MYARSPDRNLRVVAIEPGQFVRVDLTMQAKWKYNAKEDVRWYIYAKSGDRRIVIHNYKHKHVIYP